MKRIIIITNILRDPGFQYTQEVESLLHNDGFVTNRFVFPETENQDFCYFEDTTAILVLGGDGTILQASQYASHYDLPILAVNLGRLGYIAQLEKNDLNKIPGILSSPFEIETRAMLSVSLMRDEKLKVEGAVALNDAVISKYNGRGIMECSLYANEKLVNHYRGDGLIFSTATGSTAYSMSAGGCVIDPSLRIIQVTPIAAHSLKARPIVFSEFQALELIIPSHQIDACLTLDGENVIKLHPQDRIRISLASQVTKLVSCNHDFCRILYQKMSDL